MRSARILKVEIEKEAAKEIASRSRFTPRTANYLLKRSRDFAQVKKSNLSKQVVTDALTLLGVDELGLTNSDREILRCIISKFAGGPVGLNTLAASISEEQATIEEFNEPYLLQIGLIERTPRGRVATKNSYTHLDLTPPTNLQEKLL